MRKYTYLFIFVLCFASGAYLWKVNHSGLMMVSSGVTSPPSPLRPSEFPTSLAVVEVAGERITQDDVDWEYNLLTDGTFDKDSLTPIPDLGSRYQEELGTLRRSLISALIERKMLFHYIKRDRDFTSDDPSRYVACMTAWQQATESKPFQESSKMQKDRLKARLCERSLLDQYLEERLFANLQTTETEILEYFKNHTGEFKQPERVKIRHILIGNEQEARRCRGQLNAHNFADLARRWSLAPESQRGGILGPFAKGTMPPVFEMAFHLSVGSISEVLKSNYGYHILMVLERLPKEQLGLEAARPKIKSLLREQKKVAAYRLWVEKGLAAIDVRTQKRVW